MELRRWIQVICILPALQDFLVFRVCSMQCPNTTHYLTRQGGYERCCTKCGVGQRVEKHCSIGRDKSTKCVDCEEKTFQPAPSGEMRCKPCREQYKANRELKSCTREHDQEYGDCVKGFYHMAALDTCRECTRCEVGYGVKKECTKDSNTECDEEKCGVGTYSNQTSSTQKCMNCTVCKNDEEMHKECTPSSNYECKQKMATTPTKELPITTSISSISSTNLPVKIPSHAGREEGRSWVMPFFITAMVLLLVLFVAFIIGVTVWCHIHHRHQQQNIIVEAEDSQALQRLTKMVDDVESVYLPNESRNVYHDSTPERKPGGILENGMMIRDVSHDIIEELANFLNPTSPPSNWRKVASMLDFPWNVINNLALSPTTATQQLLERWGTKRDATVHKLYQTLKDIGRDDAAEVIERLLVHPVPSCPKSV